MTAFTRRALLSVAFAAGLTGGAALAEQPVVKIGITLSTTGQGAALGIPEKNSLEVVPKEIAGARIEVILLDDATDPTNATTNARRLATEDKVDILVGSSVTPPTMAIAGVAFETQTPHFALGPMPFQPGREKWTVVMPQPVSLMAKGIFDDMAKRGVKSVGMIGFSDSWGDLWVKEFKAQAEPRGMKLVANERYARADTSVSGQVLKLVAARPDAVLVAEGSTSDSNSQGCRRTTGV